MRELGALQLEPSSEQPIEAGDPMSSDDDQSYHLASLANHEAFFGKSSEFPLARQATRIKAALQGGAPTPQLNFIGKRPEYWQPPRVSFSKRTLSVTSSPFF